MASKLVSFRHVPDDGRYVYLTYEFRNKLQHFSSVY